MIKTSGVTMSHENKIIFVEICKVGHARHGKEYTTMRAMADYNEYMRETVSDCKKIGRTYYLADAVIENMPAQSSDRQRYIKKYGADRFIEICIEMDRQVFFVSRGMLKKATANFAPDRLALARKIAVQSWPEYLVNHRREIREYWQIRKRGRAAKAW